MGTTRADKGNGGKLRLSKAEFLRFFEKVNVQGRDECWLWKAARDDQGYGVFRIDGKNDRAHRVSLKYWGIKIPYGFHVDHLCRNPPCLNPGHLEPVPPRINSIRSNSASGKNSRKTHCANGHEFNESNTYLRSTGINNPKTRQCKQCNSRRKREASIRDSRYSILKITCKGCESQLTVCTTPSLPRKYCSDKCGQRYRKSINGGIK